MARNFSMAKVVRIKLRKRSRGTVRTRFKPVRRKIFLKEWRLHRGMTQEELAEIVGWSHSNVAQLEQGRQGYSDQGLALLADALNCSPGQILDVDPSEGSIWPIWETADADQRRLIVNLAKQVVAKTA